MKVEIDSGKYVVAVSGGVDSIVLLDILAKQSQVLKPKSQEEINSQLPALSPQLSLVVAHFDHGIREDSAADRKFVESLAKKYDLPFEYAEGKLGKQTSEEKARNARYEFLQNVMKNRGAKAIITAHHQDDAIETMLINLVRGTKRKGLSALKNRAELLRPLLDVPKSELLAYAKINKLKWHEDSTNADQKYLRNWLRHNVVTKLTPAQRQMLLNHNSRLGELNEELDSLINQSFKTDQQQLDRAEIIALPHDVASEVIADWLRRNNLGEFDKKTIERAVVGAKTLEPGKSVELKRARKMLVGKKALSIVS